MRGRVKFRQTTRLFTNQRVPNSNEQLIMPKGVRLLPVADFTLIPPTFCILKGGKHW